MSPKVTFIAICLILLLSACVVSDEPALELPPLTLPPPPTPVFSGDCANTRTLESWLQTTQFQQRDFMAFMNGASDLSSDDLYLNVEQMALTRNRIAEEPAPDCAEDLHREMLNVMQTTLDGLQAYVNGEETNLSALVEDAQARFNALLPEQTELLNRLEAQYQAEGNG